MRKTKLWCKSLMAAGLGLSVVMSSLSSASVAAAEYDVVNETPEDTEKVETATNETVNEVNDSVKVEPEAGAGTNAEKAANTEEIKAENGRKTARVQTLAVSQERTFYLKRKRTH